MPLEIDLTPKGPFAGEAGKIFVLDFCNDKAYEYLYLGLGGGIGFGGAVTNEIGILDIDDPGSLGGPGLNVSSFAAAGLSGASGGINGSGPQDNVYTGANGGHAMGAGAGVSGTATYTSLRNIIDIPEYISGLLDDSQKQCDCD